jgi:3-oxoadipate enol-lactonase
MSLAMAALLLAAPASTPATLAAPTSGYVATETGRLFYEAAGEGPNVVLIHDGLLHRETWDDQFALLAKQFHVVRYDRRGYGKSDVPTVPFSNVGDLEDLYAAVLGKQKATLIGCSAGGGLAIDFTLAHPELVEKLSTQDPYFVAPGSTAAHQRVNALLTANPQNLRVPWSLLRGPRVPALGRLGEIKAPTLIVIGAEDIPDVHAHGGAIQAGITGARRVVVRSAGHLVHMEQPEEFNPLALEFLAGSPKP